MACGIVSEERFWELTDPWVRQAQVFYHSWQEYAISCLCGAVYFMSHHGTVDESFYNLNYNLVRHLFEDGGAWRRNAWYRPQEREWADIFGANPVCNLDPTILAYFYADAGRKFGRTEDGWEEEF